MSAQHSPSHMLVTMDTSTLPLSEDDSAMLRSLRTVSWDEVVSRLVEVYLAQISPTMPIVTREEMMHAGSTLRHAMAAVAAARKACPREVFVALRYILRQDIATKGRYPGRLTAKRRHCTGSHTRECTDLTPHLSRRRSCFTGRRSGTFEHCPPTSLDCDTDGEWPGLNDT